MTEPTLFDLPPTVLPPVQPLGHARNGEALPDADTLNNGCREVLYAIRLVGTGTVRDVQALMPDGFERNVIARRLDDLEGFGFVTADRTQRPIVWSVR